MIELCFKINSLLLWGKKYRNVYWKFAERVDFEYSHHTYRHSEWCEEIDKLISLTVIIFSLFCAHSVISDSLLLHRP